MVWHFRFEINVTVAVSVDGAIIAQSVLRAEYDLHDRGIVVRFSV